MRIKHHQTSKQKRQLRVRSRLLGTAQRPRVSVHRTNKHIYVQAIDDDAQRTLASANDAQLQTQRRLTKTQAATLVGQLLAQKLKKAKVKQVIFDRGSFHYHGRVKAIAEALRKEGVIL